MALPIIQPFFRKPLRTALLQNAQAQKKSDTYNQRGNLIIVPSQVWSGLSTYQGVQYPFTPNLVTNGEFKQGTTGWNTTNATGNADTGSLIFTATAQNGKYGQTNAYINGSKYYRRITITANSTSVLVTTDGFSTVSSNGTGLPQTISAVFTSSLTGNMETRIVDTRASGWTSITVDDYILYNLTAIFAGFTEPTAPQMDALIAASGQTVTRGEASVELQGVTLKNELNYTPATYAEFTKSGAVGDATGLEITALNGSNTYGYVATNLKLSTKYLLVYNVVSCDLDSNFLLEATYTGSNITLGKTVGNQKIVFTTQATSFTNRFQLMTSSGNTTGKRVKVNNLRLFELPAGSQILADAEGALALTADQLAIKYPYLQGGAVRSTQFSSDVSSIVQNGNFANGTTGFSILGCTAMAVNNIVSITGNGAYNSTQFFKITSVACANGKKIYARFIARVTNANCTSIRLVIEGSTSVETIVQQINNPVQNQWYILSGIATLSTHTGNVLVNAKSYYADAATANGKVMEIDGNYGVTAIDMGADSTNPLYAKTLAEMQQLFPDYVPYGTSQKGLGYVKAIGKNLFDGVVESGTWDTNGTEVVNALYVRSKNYMSISAGSAYTKSYNATARSNHYTKCFDGNRVYLGYAASSGNTIIPLAGTVCVKFSYAVATPINQVELGTVATTYEPYTETQANIPPVTLRDVNGVRDTFKIGDGIGLHTQRNREDIINGNTIGSTPATQATTYLFGVTGWAASKNVYHPSTDASIAKGYCSDGDFSVTSTASWDARHISIYSDNTLYICIEKTKIDAQAGATLLDKGKAYLNLYPITLLYQLANPIVTPYTMSTQMGCTDGLIVDNGSTLQITPSGDVNSSTVPITTVQYPIV